MTEFVQFLVLAFTALVWWLAKRDLTARAARLRAASSAEVDQLKETVEALTAALEERVTKEEKRLSALIAEARALQSPLASVPASVSALQEVRPSSAPTPFSPPAVEVLAAPIAAAAPKPSIAVAAPSPVAAQEPVAPAPLVDGKPKEAATEPVPAAAEPNLVEEAPGNTLPEDLVASDVSAEPEIAAEPPTLHQQVMEAERRAALVRAQLAIGVIDPIEIVRRTGLPRGEVELLIGLRSLRIEPSAPIEALAPAAVSEAAAIPKSPTEAPEPVAPEAPPAPLENDRYAAIYAMLASGVTDSTEIARRTGMGRGEVELILGLRARNVL
ncbi:MAG: hypothetical protein JWQ02_1623 [Capsulimonas sp.]|nr:hypothetical protein [Capsulimonas sp.]